MTFKGGPINIAKSYFKALLELAKVVIVLVILFEAMLAYLEIRISDAFGWPQSMLYKLDFQY